MVSRIFTVFNHQHLFVSIFINPKNKTDMVIQRTRDNLKWSWIWRTKFKGSLWFQSLLKSCDIMIVYYCIKTNIRTWSGTGNPEIKVCTCGQLVFNKDVNCCMYVWIWFASVLVWIHGYLNMDICRRECLVDLHFVVGFSGCCRSQAGAIIPGWEIPFTVW